MAQIALQDRKKINRKNNQPSYIARKGNVYITTQYPPLLIKGNDYITISMQNPPLFPSNNGGSKFYNYNNSSTM
jgi:hypothetical protein